MPFAPSKASEWFEEVKIEFMQCLRVQAQELYRAPHQRLSWMMPDGLSLLLLSLLHRPYNVVNMSIYI